jgi:hypothetical protein
MTLPAGPTHAARSSLANPGPAPRSSTVSPKRNPRRAHDAGKVLAMQLVLQQKPRNFGVGFAEDVDRLRHFIKTTSE